MEKANEEAGPRRWNFFRAGGFDQVKFDTGADIAALGELDQKLWMALSCPTHGLSLDPDTLALIDGDKDGRIRASELIAAAQWTVERLKDPDLLMTPGDVLPLDAINDATPDGKRILASAKRILASLGKADATAIGAEDTADTAKVFSQTDFNGDGVLPAESTEEPTASVIEDIIECLGGQTDRSGKPGVNQETADRFFAECQAYADWQRQADERPELKPLGEATADAATAFAALRPKIEDYFVRCRLAAFEPRSADALNPDEKVFSTLAAKELTAAALEVAALPLARIAAERPLPLGEGVNPAWAAAAAAFRAQVVAPLLGDAATLTESQWAVLQEKFAPHFAWRDAKPVVSVEKLGLDRIRTILSGGQRETLTGLIAQDKALEPEFDAIASVDRLVRYRRDLLRLLNNFVSFRDFYSGRRKAIFQAGTLYLDQRSCELCIHVDDVAKHLTMSHLSRSFLIYCDCVRRASGERMSIVAAVTDGESDNLTVGRNGVFYDGRGRDWDATVVKIVENPISIREAFWGPYKRAIRWVEEQVAKRAAAADTAAVDKLKTTAVESVAAGDADQPAPPASAVHVPTPKGKFDIGTIAALGVAVGGITAALGALLNSFFGLGLWMPLGFVGLVFMISGPSMLIAALKLRQRNLGPLLDANGWAVNAKAKINIPFGQALTGMPKLPKGARRDLTDHFAERHGRRRAIIVAIVVLVLLVVVWHGGAFDRWLPEWLQSSIVPPMHMLKLKH